MPGGGFSPSDDFDETRPAGTDYGYDIDRWCTSNLQHTCNAYAAEHYEMSNDPDASEDDFGRHDFITLKQQSSKLNLTGSTNRTGFYTKATGVYLEKADGTEIQILDFTTERSGVDNDVPSGEIILFEKDTAVTGYTLQTDKDDMAVYITKGSGAGGESGGTDKTGGTWTQPDHTHTGPSHTHTGPSHRHQWFDYQATATVNNRSYNSSGTLIDLTNSSTTGSGLTLQCTSRTADDHLSQDFYTSNSGTGATGASGTGATGGSATVNTWRPSGRNFTRQARN